LTGTPGWRKAMLNAENGEREERGGKPEAASFFV
jgi:hypothetical protein